MEVYDWVLGPMSRMCWSATSPSLCGITVYRFLISRVKVSLEGPERKEKNIKKKRKTWLLSWMCERRDLNM